MNKKHIVIGLLIAVAIAVFLSPFASPSPDGLERVAEDKGFLHLAEGLELIRAWMPDYVFPGIANEALATSLAGFVGTLLVFAVLTGLGLLLTRREKAPDSRGSGRRKN